jgi:hypothetical protein
MFRAQLLDEGGLPTPYYLHLFYHHRREALTAWAEGAFGANAAALLSEANIVIARVSWETHGGHRWGVPCVSHDGSPQ